MEFFEGTNNLVDKRDPLVCAVFKGISQDPRLVLKTTKKPQGKNVSCMDN